VKKSSLIPAGLLLLSAIPLIAGALRMGELAGGPAVTPDNARYLAAPVPIWAHIVSASVFSALGAFQFVPGLRRRRRGWHRAAGRLLVPAGLVAALSGLWMGLFYPWPAGDGTLLAVLRLAFGGGMAASLVLGFLAVRRRDITAHRAWMLRAYAIGVGAGTQALVIIPWVAIVGTQPVGTPRALLLGLGWALNLAVAELLGRRRGARPMTAAPPPEPGRRPEWHAATRGVAEPRPEATA
jgi:uncharacterized membrane protein